MTGAGGQLAEFRTKEGLGLAHALNARCARRGRPTREEEDGQEEEKERALDAAIIAPHFLPIL